MRMDDTNDILNAAQQTFEAELFATPLSAFYSLDNCMTTAENCTTTSRPTVDELLEIKRQFDALPKPECDVLFMSDVEWHNLKKAIPIAECEMPRPLPELRGIPIYTYRDGSYEDYKDTLDTLLKRRIRIGLYWGNRIYVIGGP